MKAKLLLPLLTLALVAQNARVGDSGPRILLTVPMVGKGTWEDPRRPAFVAEAGTAFRFQLSDDGATALVEASPRDAEQMAKLTDLVTKDGRGKLFRPEKDKLSDVVAEFKKLKKDFDSVLFGILPVQGLLPTLPLVGK